MGFSRFGKIVSTGSTEVYRFWKMIALPVLILAFNQYLLLYHSVPVPATTSTTIFAKADIHDSHTSILDLLQWERENMFSNGTGGVAHSKAPPNTPVTCSLGSLHAASNGNLLTTNSCGGGEATYARVLQKAKDLINLDDEVCDVCRILDLSRVHNLTTITFWGDSVQNQVFDGFVCETSRRNYVIISDKYEPQRSCGGILCIKSIRTVKIGTSAAWDHSVTLKFFFQYKPSTFIEANVHPIVAAGTDILFFNFGLHFHPHETSKYQDRMRLVMNELKKTNNNISLLAFRETSAQHWNGNGGEYKNRNGTECAPLDTTYTTKDSLFGWRDRVFSAAAEQSGFRVLVADPSSKNSLSLLPRTIHNEVVVVPFANFSAEFYDLHAHECTHYCSTPHLWYPLWRSLRFAMSRRFES